MAPIVKLRYEDGADRGIALPDYASAGAAGADLRANLSADQRESGIELAPGARALVPTGLSVELPEGYEAQVRARSGLALKKGIAVLNGPGTIDSDYRGPLGVILANLGQESFRVIHGERIAQLVVAPVVQARFEPAETLGESARGTGGFGSTGLG